MFRILITFHKQFIHLMLSAQNGTTSGLIAPDATSTMNFASSKWIWNSATATANTVVGLRKDFTPPLGKSLIAAEIIFTVYTSLPSIQA
jgi:hypothetical protein